MPRAGRGRDEPERGKKLSSSALPSTLEEVLPLGMGNWGNWLVGGVTGVAGT